MFQKLTSKESVLCLFVPWNTLFYRRLTVQNKFKINTNTERLIRKDVYFYYSS